MNAGSATRPKAKRPKLGEGVLGIKLPLHQVEGLGEHCKLPQWDRLMKGFLAFYKLQVASPRT